MKVRKLITGFGFAAALAGSAGTALAQAADEYIPYGQARDWAVSAVKVEGTFARCAAENPNVGFALENSTEGYTLVLSGPPSNPTEYKAYLDISPKSFSVTFYPTADGRYITFLEPKLLNAIKGGQKIAYYMDGGEVTVWPLAGATAALLKLQECVERGGEGGIAAPAAVAPAPVESDAARLGAGCPAPGAQISPRSTTPAKATFVNKSDQAVSIYWIDFKGQIQEMGATLPGETFEAKTFAGHFWLAKDFDGKCHGGIFTAVPGQNRFVFD